MKRIKATAKNMRDELLTSNRHVPWGATEVEPQALVAETVVRFGW